MVDAIITIFLILLTVLLTVLLQILVGDKIGYLINKLQKAIGYKPYYLTGNPLKFLLEFSFILFLLSLYFGVVVLFVTAPLNALFEYLLN